MRFGEFSQVVVADAIGTKTQCIVVARQDKCILGLPAASRGKQAAAEAKLQLGLGRVDSLAATIGRDRGLVFASGLRFSAHLPYRLPMSALVVIQVGPMGRAKWRTVL